MMPALVASPWIILGSVIGMLLLVVVVARLCHRLVACPHCGKQSHHYVGFCREWRAQAQRMGPVYCRYCQARFVFLA
jgi:hypothetical protein